MLSVANQTVVPNEVIIADDGSKSETKELVSSLKARLNFPIKHVWHQDDGFRKTIILNEAIRVSLGDYIIQTDGDILLHKNFIQDHLENCEQGYFIRGSRSLISEQRTHELLHQKIAELKWTDSGLSNKFNSIFSPGLSKLFSIFDNPNSIEGVKGCNFSFWKKDFLKVNGFNNDFCGWGREDSEIAARLINSGVKKKHLKFRAVCFHLHHEFFSRESDKKNIEMLNRVIDEKIAWAKDGFSTVHPAVLF